MESLESTMSTTESTAGERYCCPVYVPPCVQQLLGLSVVCSECIVWFVSTEAERNRLTTVLQENAVLKSEIEIYKLKVKSLTEENRRLRQASVTIVSVCVCTQLIGRALL